MTAATSIAFVQELESGYGYDNCIVITVNGDDAGYLAITNPDENGISLIEYVEIFKEYQGKGFYKMLLKAAFELNSSLDMLLSKDRNEDSNPIYQKWVGFEFGFRRHVTISICDNELIFN